MTETRGITDTIISSIRPFFYLAVSAVCGVVMVRESAAFYQTLQMPHFWAMVTASVVELAAIGFTISISQSRDERILKGIILTAIFLSSVGGSVFLYVKPMLQKQMKPSDVVKQSTYEREIASLESDKRRLESDMEKSREDYQARIRNKPQNHKTERERLFAESEAKKKGYITEIQAISQKIEVKSKEYRNFLNHAEAGMVSASNLASSPSMAWLQVLWFVVLRTIMQATCWFFPVLAFRKKSEKALTSEVQNDSMNIEEQNRDIETRNQSFKMKFQGIEKPIQYADFTDSMRLENHQEQCRDSRMILKGVEVQKTLSQTERYEPKPEPSQDTDLESIESDLEKGIELSKTEINVFNYLKRAGKTKWQPLTVSKCAENSEKLFQALESLSKKGLIVFNNRSTKKKDWEVSLV